MHLRFEVINTVACPKCKAEIGESCRQGAKGKGKHKPRSKNHQARLDAATKIDRVRKAKRGKLHRQHSKPEPQVIETSSSDWLTNAFMATIQEQNMAENRFNGRNADGTFSEGNAGRPRGARNKATLAVLDLLDGQVEALTNAAIQKALGVDTFAGLFPSDC